MTFLLEDAPHAPISKLLTLVQGKDTFIFCCGCGRILQSIPEVKPDVVVLDLPLGNKDSRGLYFRLVKTPGIVVAPIVCAEHCALSALKSVRPVADWVLDCAHDEPTVSPTWEQLCKGYFKTYAKCGIVRQDCCGAHGYKSLLSKAELVRSMYPSGSLANIIERANAFVSELNARMPKNFAKLPLQKLSDF